jgi:hypothetical protein
MNNYMFGVNPGCFVLSVRMSRWLQSRANGLHSCSVALLADTGQRCHMAQVEWILISVNTARWPARGKVNAAGEAANSRGLLIPGHYDPDGMPKFSNRRAWPISLSLKLRSGQWARPANVTFSNNKALVLPNTSHTRRTLGRPATHSRGNADSSRHSACLHRFVTTTAFLLH